jgi:hypothetical protein
MFDADSCKRLIALPGVEDQIVLFGIRLYCIVLRGRLYGVYA